RDDLHEALVPQLPAHRAEDPGPPRITTLTQQHRGVLVEPDVGTVRPPLLLGGADHDRLDHVALLDRRARDRFLHRGHDLVADAGVTPPGATEDPDTQDLPGSGVVRDPQPRLLLNHRVSPPSRLRRRWRVPGVVLTWPAPESPPPATAWWPTAVGSPSARPGPRCRTRCSRHAPSADWCGA